MRYHRDRAELPEVIVESEGRLDFRFFHDNSADAIREAPILVLERAKDIERELNLADADQMQ